MTPSFPPLNVNLTTSSRSGDINAPNTVYFGGFGPGSAGGGGLDGVVAQYWPIVAIGVGVFLLMRKRSQ